jgi:hypothetical protein
VVGAVFGGRAVGDSIIDRSSELALRRGLKRAWVDSSFVSMALDLTKGS